MTQSSRHLIVALLLLLCPLLVQAQGFSYVYIQGDKKTPIYTKVEGVMMPRYGKNYALLSRLAPGPLNIEILFQQNEFPPLTFTILVPENGKRAFVLSRKGDEYSLFDVEQNFYLKPGNDIADDHLPSVLNNATLKTLQQEQVPEPPKEAATEPVAATNTAEQTPKQLMPPDTTANTITTADEQPAKTTTETAAAPAGDTAGNAPAFIDNITFNNDAAAPAGTATTATINAENGTNPESAAEAVVTNSDCKTTINVTAYLRLRNSLNTARTEEERLGILKNAAKQHCFTTDQVKELTARLETDLARLSALKDFYPKVSDQSRFGQLADTLQENSSKEYFAELIAPH